MRVQVAIDNPEDQVWTVAWLAMKAATSVDWCGYRQRAAK
jgi:hypothetical protein